MKKQLLIAALTLVSASAYASKARLSSLQDAAHLSDIRDVLTKPNAALTHGEWVNMELGQKPAATATGYTSGSLPQGGFVRSSEGTAWGLYLGNNTAQSTYRNLDTKFLDAENSFALIYAMDMGEMTTGVNFTYSNSSRKPDAAAISATNPEKDQNAMGIVLSAAAKDAWDVQFQLGLAGSAKYLETNGGTETKLTGSGTMKLSGGYNMGSMYVYGYYGTSGAKSETGSTVNFDRKDTDMKIGVVNSHKKDGTDFFYGAGYQSSVLKEGEAAGSGLVAYGAGTQKVEATKIPVIVGIETDAASWLVLRGSLTQNFFMDSVKVSTANATTMNWSNANSMVVAAGAGLKFGKMTLDGTLQSADSATGAFGSDSAGFLANTSFTYMF